MVYGTTKNYEKHYLRTLITSNHDILLSSVEGVAPLSAMGHRFVAFIGQFVRQVVVVSHIHFTGME
jgi:hypothetical protein